MDDSQLREVLIAQIPRILEGLRQVVDNGHIFGLPLCTVSDSYTGQQQQVVMFLSPVVPAAILEGVIQGMGEANRRAQMLQQQSVTPPDGRVQLT